MCFLPKAYPKDLMWSFIIYMDLVAPKDTKKSYFTIKDSHVWVL